MRHICSCATARFRGPAPPPAGDPLCERQGRKRKATERDVVATAFPPLAAGTPIQLTASATGTSSAGCRAGCWQGLAGCRTAPTSLPVRPWTCRARIILQAAPMLWSRALCGALQALPLRRCIRARACVHACGPEG